MPDLRKLLFFSRDKNYVDLTHLSTQRKNNISLKRKKISPKVRSKLLKIKIKKIKFPKPLPKRKILKVQKALPKRSKIVAPSKIPKPFKQPVRPLKSPKPIIKPVLKIKTSPAVSKEILVGEVTHFFDKIKVCVIKLARPLKVNDMLHFFGKESDFVQKIDSMQINHQQVVTAKKGDEIGLKTIREVRPGDEVFLQ